MTITSPLRLLRRNKQPIPPKHGQALAQALTAELERLTKGDKTGLVSPKLLARALIDNPDQKSKLLQRLGGDCDQPQCKASFHAALCHLAYS